METWLGKRGALPLPCTAKGAMAMGTSMQWGPAAHVGRGRSVGVQRKAELLPRPAVDSGMLELPRRSHAIACRGKCPTHKAFTQDLHSTHHAAPWPREGEYVPTCARIDSCATASYRTVTSVSLCAAGSLVTAQATTDEDTFPSCHQGGPLPPTCRETPLRADPKGLAG